MAKLKKMFFKGRMNKTADARYSPKGEHTDALNIRINSTADDNAYVVETAVGNKLVASPDPEGYGLSDLAVGIGSFEDSESDRVFVFVHDPTANTSSGVMDLIYSYSVNTGAIDYHLVSINDGSGETTTKFSTDMVITEFELVENELYFLVPGRNPMVIDTSVVYGTDTTTDQFSIYDILVIKRPPLSSPDIELLTVGDSDDFLSERFVCYGYRYRYSNNKYSATSPFSIPAFLPNLFEISYESFNNEGMRNLFNASRVTINSGDSDVIGFDILMKDSRNNLIKVVQRINKEDEGIIDNDSISYVFSSDKVFSSLPQSEILRLYDNVPLTANTMTRMGNRIMYSDYTEGFDMVDVNNNKFNSVFETNLISSIGNRLAPDTTVGQGFYVIDGTARTANNVSFSIDFSGVDLNIGSFVRVNITVDHDFFSGATPYPVETPGPLSTTLEFFLLKNYSSVYEMASSDEFKRAVGTSAYVTTMANACSAAPTSLTDSLNCIMPSSLSGLDKFASGINTAGGGSQITTSPGSNIVQIQIPAYVYQDDPVAPTRVVYSFLSIVEANTTFQSNVNNRSLHSDWEYETFMVYTDEFGRSSLPIPSENNTVKVPFENSIRKNSLRVTIPSNMRPPKWATNFKFVLRSNKEAYQTIYSSFVFKEEGSNASHFLLQGENAAKVEVGDTLIVKADVDGPTQSKKEVIVLEKEVYESAKFDAISPAGVYIKVIANDFNTEIPDDSVIITGTKRDSRTAGIERDSNDFPYVAYGLNEDDPTNPGSKRPIEITTGTTATISFNIGRRGYGNSCEAESYRFKKTFIASANYTSFKDWWDAENLNFDDNTEFIGAGGTANTWNYNSVLLSAARGPKGTDIPSETDKNKILFFLDTGSNQLFMLVRSGVPSCTGLFEPSLRASKIEFRIDIIKGGNNIIFETKPSLTAEDIYYEGNQSFQILNDAHAGNIQNQTIGTAPSVIDLNFFNCFTFGNGAESYRIDDSVTGRDFTIGERVYGTQSEEFREVRRYSDITYSGIFNDESNVNKLNEFNAGLLNFKRLEESFGPVAKIDGRATDVLVLQQDKISYVLSGKNLLSDSTGGGPIASVPEVLGTVMSRVEDFGCSNRESFSKHGPLKSFVDTKRAVVIQLTGGGYNSDTLSVITNGMRSYFRNLMTENDNKIFLGCYDKFNQEYVIHTNEQDKPGFTQVYNCGSTRNLEVLSGTPQVFDIDFGSAVGSASIEYKVGFLTGTVEISINYNGVVYTSGPVDANGSFSFDKTLPSREIGTVTVTASAGTANVEVKVNCVQSTQLSVRSIVITSNSDVNKTAHVGYSWDRFGYFSPNIIDEVVFSGTTSSINRSLDKTRTGRQGSPSIPVQQADIKMFVQNNSSDSFNFDPSKHKMYWLRTDANLTDAQLLTSTTDGVPVLQDSSGNYYHLIDFLTATGSTLYLIFDLRENTSKGLCYSNVSAFDACCNC